MATWIIQATRHTAPDKDGWRKTMQVPTFYLPESLGVLTEATAMTVAKEILRAATGEELNITAGKVFEERVS